MDHLISSFDCLEISPKEDRHVRSKHAQILGREKQGRVKHKRFTVKRQASKSAMRRVRRLHKQEVVVQALIGGIEIDPGPVRFFHKENSFAVRLRDLTVENLTVLSFLPKLFCDNLASNLMPDVYECKSCQNRYYGEHRHSELLLNLIIKHDSEDFVLFINPLDKMKLEDIDLKNWSLVVLKTPSRDRVVSKQKVVDVSSSAVVVNSTTNHELSIQRPSVLPPAPGVSLVLHNLSGTVLDLHPCVVSHCCAMLRHESVVSNFTWESRMQTDVACTQRDASVSVERIELSFDSLICPHWSGFLVPRFVEVRRPKVTVLLYVLALLGILFVPYLVGSLLAFHLINLLTCVARTAVVPFGYNGGLMFLDYFCYGTWLPTCMYRTLVFSYLLFSLMVYLMIWMLLSRNVFWIWLFKYVNSYKSNLFYFCFYDVFKHIWACSPLSVVVILEYVPQYVATLGLQSRDVNVILNNGLNILSRLSALRIDAKDRERYVYDSVSVAAYMARNFQPLGWPLHPST
jgi:hypothetical protein